MGGASVVYGDRDNSGILGIWQAHADFLSPNCHDLLKVDTLAEVGTIGLAQHYAALGARPGTPPERFSAAHATPPPPPP